MNLLQLVQLLQQESSGIQSITTAQNQTGELKRMVDWVKQADRSIQRRHPNWRWMRKGFQILVPANTGSLSYDSALVTDYDPDTGLTGAAIGSRFSRWIDGDVQTKIFETSAGESSSRWINWLEFDEFKQMWRLQPQPPAPPAFYSIDPENQLVLGPETDTAYTIIGEYQRNSVALVNDTDEPEYPEEFHELAVWEALKKYGLYESAQEAISRANFEASQIWHKLEFSQKPQTNFGNPLA